MTINSTYDGDRLAMSPQPNKPIKRRPIPFRPERKEEWVRNGDFCIVCPQDMLQKKSL